MKVDGRVFLVTGASSGLGLATAELLVGKGAFVALLDRDTGDTSRFSALGEAAKFYGADVVNEESVKAALSSIVKDFGGIHGIINCAGVASAEKVYTPSRGPQSLENFEYVMRVNVLGTFNVIRLAVDVMAKQETQNDDGERGVIVNVASVAAFDGQVGQVAYSASKAAVAGMTLPLAREFGSFGIRVVTIAPGIFLTPMMEAASDKVKKSLLSNMPFPRRFGAPREFAMLCEQIITNPMLNGETIRLDGSIRMPAL